LAAVFVLADAVMVCVDIPNWVDNDTEGCDDYAFSGYCDLSNPPTYYGAGLDENETLEQFADSDGVHAGIACCACGGGDDVDCVDMPDWVDSDTEGCDDYVSKNYCDLNNTPTYEGAGLDEDETLEQFADSNGVHAATACCACGGGNTTEPAPSPMEPTPVPSSMEPTPENGTSPMEPTPESEPEEEPSPAAPSPAAAPTPDAPSPDAGEVSGSWRWNGVQLTLVMSSFLMWKSLV